MKVRRFTPAQVEEMVSALMQKGMHPAKIRRYLADYGIRWSYQVVGQGRNERVRRLAKQGRALCACGNGSYPLDMPSALCDDCLRKKWGGTDVVRS